MEDKEKIEAGNTNTNLENTQEKNDNVTNSSELTEFDTSEENPRKITQTDHLNKRLLNAFLDKINHEAADNSNLSDSEDSWEEEQPGH